MSESRIIWLRNRQYAVVIWTNSCHTFVQKKVEDEASDHSYSEGRH
jgi:hypothetical protein